WGLGGLCLFGVLGCESAVVGPAVVPVKPVPVVEARVKGLGDGVSGEFVSLRFGLKLPLPDGKGWRIDDHDSSWFVARHAASGSELVLKGWREDAVMNRARCEERARFWRKIPERESADIVEKHAVDVPSGFDTVVEVGVIAPALMGKKARAGEDLRGVAMAFGGKGRRCFAWIYTTSAGGQGAEVVLGERLATMVQGSLSVTTTVNELEPQIERTPAP
ncbi:MAG: hypothetical protein ABJE95_33325, partial [Byssovorax sp.]